MVERMSEIEEVKGNVLSSYGRVRVFEGFPYYYYEISPRTLDSKGAKIKKTLEEVLLRRAPLSDVSKALEKSLSETAFNSIRAITGKIENQALVDTLPGPEKIEELKKMLSEFLQKYSELENPEDFAQGVLESCIGFGVLSELTEDQNLEEIMVNSKDSIFVFHRSFGMCKTNLKLQKEEDLLAIVSKIAKRVGKSFDSNNPLLDARLPDGNRANATYAPATPFGITLTIRKFKKEPLTVIDLIANNTLSSEVAAFLWAMVEGLDVEPMNMIVTGGASTGKTTTLNCLAQFMNYRNRVVTIEDTLELQLGNRENWIQMEARMKTVESREVTMDDLLKNALRMRPDRILVGEVRGGEAQTMFVAMDTGHRGMMGTVHANNAKETLIRLKSEPMSVPESMLPLLDLIVVQYRQYVKDKGMIRRISQVAEISRMDEKVLLSNIFEWDRSNDLVKKTDVPARVLETLAERAGITKKELMREIAVRQKILEWMLENNIREQAEVEKIIQGYYFNPKYILEKITKGIF
ncbi:MAG: CpaF family protein [Candidatus Diapherotrites archaeon]|uniref:CpaF family protein n=1 Tax=Candidatus Iainarchaeum sp. TaxID=3101447 RepID=A0A8T4KYH0_9ARCH|nr:CpaF family protein [Candidatus Diapherotrites archaeon]